jgi:hypothetical protein
MILKLAGCKTENVDGLDVRSPSSVGYYIRLVWFFGCIIAATIVGVLIGWTHYGVLGAIGVGLLGFIIGGIFGAAPSLLAEFLGGTLSR